MFFVTKLLFFVTKAWNVYRFWNWPYAWTKAGKMACDVSHLYQFIPAQAWTSFLLLILYTEPCVILRVKYAV